MLRAVATVSGLRAPGLAASFNPALAASSRGFSVTEAGRTSGGATVDPEGQEATAMYSTVDELAKGMVCGAKVPFGAGPDTREPGVGVRNEGKEGVARKMEGVRQEAPAGRMEDEVAGGAERLRATPHEDSGHIITKGGGKGSSKAGAGPGDVEKKPLRGEGHGPRGWGAAESDSEAPPCGVILE